MKINPDKKYKKAVSKPNFADGMNCSAVGCQSIAYKMLYKTLSLCPYHYADFVDSYHNEQYEKLSKEITAMKDSYELSLRLKDERHILEMNQADEAYSKLAEEFQQYLLQPKDNWIVKIKEFFTRNRELENLLNIIDGKGRNNKTDTERMA